MTPKQIEDIAAYATTKRHRKAKLHPKTKVHHGQKHAKNEDWSNKIASKGANGGPPRELQKNAKGGWALD